MKVQGNRYINNPEMIKNKVEKKTTVPQNIISEDDVKISDSARKLVETARNKVSDFHTMHFSSINGEIREIPAEYKCENLFKLDLKATSISGEQSAFEGCSENQSEVFEKWLDENASEYLTEDEMKDLKEKINAMTADVDSLNAQEGYRGTSYESVFLLSASEAGLRKVNEMYVPEQLQAGFSDMIDEYVHFNDSARNSIMERMTPDYMVVGIGSKTFANKVTYHIDAERNPTGSIVGRTSNNEERSYHKMEVSNNYSTAKLWGTSDKKVSKSSEKNKWKLTDSLKEKIVELAKKDAQDNVYMGNAFMNLRKMEVSKVAPNRAALIGKFNQSMNSGNMSAMKEVEKADKKWLCILFGIPYEAEFQGEGTGSAAHVYNECGEEVLTYTEGVGWQEKETKAESQVHSALKSTYYEAFCDARKALNSEQRTGGMNENIMSQDNFDMKA
jgi:hypothetical protein